MAPGEERQEGAGERVRGLPEPSGIFTSGEPYRVQFELFVDTYESGDSVRATGGGDRFGFLGEGSLAGVGRTERTMTSPGWTRRLWSS